ncbi:Hypothetical predicted protein [Mytilus galloprovincialis]|uniref:Uncharacterized protein n=1 Tax=Mytilus galloprovincialis TaxID=29158 RepID=A0A8B6CL70_MYTGA|nr:Hypothetical predicted protein [Mytilus galloprovincialis]
MKDETSNSWFTHIRIILQKYSLPTAFEIMNNPPSKTLWKKQIDSAINKYWEESWRDEIEQKKSLKYLNLQELATKHPHNILKTTQNNIRDISKATIKAHLLTGTYTLQADRK